MQPQSIAADVDEAIQVNMARIFITGSSDGIGLAAARLLVEQGHKVTLHARSAERAKQSKEAVPKAEGVLIADLSSLAETKQLAEAANKAGPWDAVVHNAGVGPSAGESRTAEGLATVFAVNSLAPYVLTALMERPRRLLYMSSGLHTGGDGGLEDMGWQGSGRPWNAFQAYCDSKLQNVVLANAVARTWPEVQSCSMDPGWVKTKMGGAGALGGVDAPARALAAYAAGEGGVAGGTGLYFGIGGTKEPHAATNDTAKQELYLKTCREMSGVELSR